MPTCCAFGCTNRASKKIPGITFHSFPRNKELKEQWVKALSRKNFTPSNYSVVCSEHFEENAFDRTSCLLVRLQKNSVPSIFKGFPNYLQKRMTRSTRSKKRGRRKEIANDSLQMMTLSTCKKQGRRKEIADDTLQDKCEGTEMPVAELKVSQTYELLRTQENSLPSETSEHILPEREPYCSSNKARIKYLQQKNELSFTMDEANTDSSQSESDPLSSNETCSKPEQLTVETSVSSRKTCNKYGVLWNKVSLDSSMGNDHLYSNTVSPTVLKQKLDLVCNRLNEVNRKLKIEEEKYRQAEKTIVKLKRIIQKLER